ncbi:MAG: thioester domain-containing protein [Christensenellales bacterium]
MDDILEMGNNGSYDSFEPLYDYDFNPEAEGYEDAAFYGESSMIDEPMDFSNLNDDPYEMPDAYFGMDQQEAPADIYRFSVTIDGSEYPLYCVRHAASSGDEPYQAGSPLQTLENHPQRQQDMVAWISQNAYPATSAEETFMLADVDAAAEPFLDEDDAFAAVQVAIWLSLGQIDADEAVFLDCGTGEVHPKSHRLRAAAFSLFSQAGQFAGEDAFEQPMSFDAPFGQDTSFEQGAFFEQAARFEQDMPFEQDAPYEQAAPFEQAASFTGDADTLRERAAEGAYGSRDRSIFCCNAGSIPKNPYQPYIVFTNCPRKARKIRGRLVIGPFLLRSNCRGKVIISFQPLQLCKDDFSVSFVDDCGRPIARPTVGKKFYLVLKSFRSPMCFYMTASISGFVALQPAGNEGGPRRNQDALAGRPPSSCTAATQVCICLQKQKKPIKPVPLVRAEDSDAGFDRVRDIHVSRSFRPPKPKPCPVRPACIPNFHLLSACRPSHVSPCHSGCSSPCHAGCISPCHSGCFPKFCPGQSRCR